MLGKFMFYTHWGRNKSLFQKIFHTFASDCSDEKFVQFQNFSIIEYACIHVEILST